MSQDAKVNLEEAEVFLSACRDYASRIEAAVQALRNSVVRVGETWRDPDYDTICGMMSDIERDVSAALRVANEDIVLYVSKKVGILQSK